MATSTTTTGFHPQVSAPPAQAVTAGAYKRRRISPQAGHALEILGHTIEYLTDEFVHEGGSFNSNNAQLQAVQLLMAVNRQIYLECPEVPSLRQRLASFLRIHQN